MTKKNIFRYTAIFFVIIETFSIIRGYVLVRDWIFLSLMCNVSMILYPKAFLNKQTFFLLLYFLTCLFVSAGHTMADMKWATDEVFVPLACLSIINVFLCNRDFYGLKMVTVIGLLIIVITSLLTITIAINDPTSVRRMVDLSADSDNDSVQFYQRLGIAGFGLVHALPFLFPLLVFHFKTAKTKISQLPYLVAIVVPYYMIVKASFGTPLVLSTVGILISFFLSDNKKRNLVLGLILSFFLLFSLHKGLIISGLNSIQPMFEGTAIANKVNDIVISIQYGEAEGEVVGRSDLYKMSWSTFFQNPLFGSSDKTGAGGHAYFADRLAYFGLVGIIPFIMFFYFTFKKHLSLIERRKKIYYVLSLSHFILLGFLKNIGGIECFLYLCVFLPGLCLMEELQGNKIKVSL